MKPDKMPYIIYADLEYFIKKQTDAQTIQKNLQQQKLEKIFLEDNQCQQSGSLTI